MWYIGFEEEVGEFNLPNLITIIFELDRGSFYVPAHFDIMHTIPVHSLEDQHKSHLRPGNDTRNNPSSILLQTHHMAAPHRPDVAKWGRPMALHWGMPKIQKN